MTDEHYAPDSIDAQFARCIRLARRDAIEAAQPGNTPFVTAWFTENRETYLALAIGFASR